MAKKGAQPTGFDEVFGAANQQKLQEYMASFSVDVGGVPVYQVSVTPIYKWVDGKKTDTVETNELGHAKAYREFSLGEPNGKQRFRYVEEFKTPADAASAMELNGKQVDFVAPMITPKVRQTANKNSGYIKDVYSWTFSCHGVKEHENVLVKEYEQELQEQQELEDAADGK